VTDFLERLIDGDALVVPDLWAHRLVPVATGSPYVTLWILRAGGDGDRA
jgi:hypothetical protein